MPKTTGATSPPPRLQPLAVLTPENTAEAYDTLAELFLGEVGSARAGGGNAGIGAGPGASGAGRDGSRRAPADSAAPVECLILGHLPVLGSAWVSQYARCIAEEEDVTVALVQVRAGYATVEIVLSEDDHVPQPPQARASLEAAIDAAAAVAGRWILRVEEPDEPVVASHTRVTLLTLLTSADEIASVAAYRTLKRLLGDESDGPDGGDERPRVRISVMGAPEDAADAVFAKLAGATRMFIHRPIERAPGVHRVTPKGASLVLFSGPVEQGAERVMEAIGRPRRRMRLMREDEPEVAKSPAAREGAGAFIDSVVPEGAADAAMPEGEVVLASHIPGLAPLDIACPYTPGVQLGVDGEGRLHVMAWHDARGGDGQGVDGLEPLTVAAAWATSHLPLLAAASSVLSAAGGPPVLHMFVDDPRGVRRLLLDAPIRVHLLAPVSVEGRTGWLYRGLN